jgi:hypothetical protein
MLRIRIRCLFDPWIRDPGWGKKSGSGSGMDNPDHISESLETFFWVKIPKFFDANPGPPEREKFGSVMGKNSDPVKTSRIRNTGYRCRPRI